MKTKIGMSINDMSITLIFTVMIMWDALEQLLPKCQFIILILVFLIYVFNYRRFMCSKKIATLSLMVIIHGIINIFLGNDSVELFGVQLISIVLCVMIFNTIFKDSPISKIMNIYYHFALIASVYGIIQFASYLSKGQLERMTSFFSEPSFFAYFLMPVVAHIIISVLDKNMKDEKSCVSNHKLMNFLIICVFLMSFSTIAYLGIVLTFLILWLKQGINSKKILYVVGAILVVCVAYNTISYIRIRIDDTIKIFSSVDKFSANYSTYTLYNNLHVTKEALKDSFALGAGLGSYRNMFDRYSLGLGMSGLYNMNREDGNSMLLRISTELGIVGVVSIFFFIKKYYLKGKNMYSGYCCALLVLIILFLVRQGNYTHGCSIAIWCLYYKTWKEFNAKKKILK